MEKLFELPFPGLFHMQIRKGNGKKNHQENSISHTVKNTKGNKIDLVHSKYVVHLVFLLQASVVF